MDQQRTTNPGGGGQGGQNKPTAAGTIGSEHRESGGEAAERARNITRNIPEGARPAAGAENAERGKGLQSLGEQARAIIGDENIERAKSMAREKGARAGEYVTRNVHENPYAALLIAGAVGYGIAYLIHTRS